MKELGMFLCQQIYAKDILEMYDCKAISNLVEPNTKLCTLEGLELENFVSHLSDNYKAICSWSGKSVHA